MKALITAVSLPAMVVIFIPAGLLYITHSYLGETPIISMRWYGLVLSGLLFVSGLCLMAGTVHLFMTIGRGTPAPWDPPKELVIAGPYRYVRNPMITGGIFLLAGQALLFGSWLILSWAAVFFITNWIYFPLVEEKGLIKRFGERYLEYKRNVPRWIPRITPYEGN